MKITKRKANGVLADMIANMDEDSLAKTREKMMGKIVEDYCSYEAAKLLKEKGFNGQTHGNMSEIPCVCYITHQMAMKWLREVHHIVMSISPTCGMLGQFNGYLIIIDKIVDGVIDNQDEFGLDTLSYKEAVEAALKYCLTNLI